MAQADLPKRVLVLFAHPYFEASRVNRALIGAIENLPNVVLHDLYETYPDQLIDMEWEQSLLSNCDVLVLQHPLYWYSCPPLMKNWIDTVLTRGWAYGLDANGKPGTALQGKSWIQAISSGGPETVYQRGGHNNFTLAELLRPFEQTADLCSMYYHQPFLIQGVTGLDSQALNAEAKRYRDWLESLVNGNLSPEVNSVHGVQVDFLSK